MPKIYGLVVEIFKLPETITVEQQEGIVENIRSGLERTLEQYPIMVGDLEWDPASGEVGVRKNRDSALGLEVRYLDGEGEEFPTFNSWKRGIRKVFPDFTSGLLAAENVPAATFQLTFFRGGCTIGWAVHHQLSDGACFEQFMTLWADNSRAAAQGTAFPPTQFEFSKSGSITHSLPIIPYKPIEKTLDIKGSPLEAERPSPARWEQIKDSFPELTEEPAAPLPEGFVFPEVVSTMWHFPKKKVEQLKAETMAQVGEGKWISTYDAIMALMWQSVTRARLDFLKPDHNAHSVLGHMVDIRKKIGFSGRFIGITSLPPQCGPLTIKELVDPANHAKVASTVRSSINSLTPEYMADFNQYVAQSSDKRRFRFDHQWFFGPDLGATSWLHYQSYKQHDFGFGLPRAIRWPRPLVEYVYIFPTRRGVEGADADEGIEVCVALEAGCAKRMLNDPMLKWYANPRGNEPLGEMQSVVVEEAADAETLRAAL
ncbi:hypothetical protein N0V90_012526 [Kalmusia sp. IMI 367209]|nr:hypothetical protein N0V90_012526 [Kalmusia sp. IMI 367209]